MDPALRGNGESLPVELFSRIFEYLSFERYHAEITSCRLVSRRWCEISSPYLITTAVIADRLSTLQKLREVLEHPYFNKHVTRLVWDGSSYRGLDFRDYGANLHSDFARWRVPTKLEPSGTRESRRIDLASVNSLLRDTTDNLNPITGEMELSTCVESWRETEHEWDKTQSLHRGFVENHRRYQLQVRLRQSRASLRYLHMAFQKLPHLRHFEYTDFRILSRNRETFSSLCTRLFGSVIPPSLLFDEPSHWLRDEDRFTSWSPLRGCLQELLKINPKLESLCFGRTNFNGPDIITALRAPLLRFDEKHIPQDDEKWRQMLCHTEYLSLPVNTLVSRNHSSSRPFERLENIVDCVRKLLSYSEASLKHLELVTKPLSGYYPTHAWFRDRAEPILGQILSRPHFQKPHTVTLRGWFFSLQDIQGFLLKHATTLREVHIIDCALTDCTEAMLLEMAEDMLGPALNLTGVEVCGLAFNVAVSLARDVGDKDCLHLSQGCAVHVSPGQNQYPCYDLGRGPRPKSASEQLELESALMGGRRNCIQRVIDENATRRYDEWWTEHAS